jgi:hypothetical protein
MNETLSLVLVTGILALGGVGLYIYKSEDENSVKKGGKKIKNYDEDEDDDYDENNIFNKNKNTESLSDEENNEDVAKCSTGTCEL